MIIEKYTGKIYGYARISTPKQSINRQITNIKERYPDAVIIEEQYSGTTVDRPAFNSLIGRLNEGDTVVFDEVSRMSRSADEGIRLYEELFDRGVNLVYIKEPHINTDVYRSKLNRKIEKIKADTGSKATDKLLNAIFAALR
ncbi:MAG: recombinase family protein, partial [Lachnospiraceae bacterium]|nr:recombinase family protein [Lachnospiraceae bacterium]